MDFDAVFSRKTKNTLAAALTLIASGCAVTPPHEEAHDPLESYNRTMDSINESIDKAILKPVATGYTKVVPSPVRSSVHNFFSNLGEPLTIVNALLQGKPKQGLQDSMRFVWNTTAGVAGLFDVATSMDLPHHDEDFGQTFAVWGMGEGAHIVLPLLGHSNVRDTIGLFPDSWLDPVGYHDEVRERNSMYALRIVDTRAQLLTASKVRDTAALDSYIFTREAYRQLRWDRIHDGNAPEPEYDFE